MSNGHGGARPGTGRKPGITGAVADGLDDAIVCAAMALERLCLLRTRPAYQPSGAELTQLGVERVRRQIDRLPPAA